MLKSSTRRAGAEVESTTALDRQDTRCTKDGGGKMGGYRMACPPEKDRLPQVRPSLPLGWLPFILKHPMSGRDAFLQLICGI